jgi:hypothetical protein
VVIRVVPMTLGSENIEKGLTHGVWTASWQASGIPVFGLLSYQNSWVCELHVKPSFLSHIQNTHKL